MGYESRLYIVETHDTTKYAQEIARFNMRKMGGNGWIELFDAPFEYDMYSDDGNTLIKEDGYGDKLKYADFDSTIKWLETKGKGMDYRRIDPLLAFLKSIDHSRSRWGSLKIVHFGY